MLVRLGRRCFRRRRLVFATWIVVVIGLGVAAATAGGSTTTVFDVPGTESQRAFDLLSARFPERAGDTAEVVWHSQQGIKRRHVQRRVEALLGRVARLDHVVSVLSPYEGAPTISADKSTAFASVQFDQRGTALPKSLIEQLTQLVEDANEPGLQVEAGGRVVQFASMEGPGGRAEQIGLLFAIVVLLISFGSVVAAGLPILTALLALGAGLSGLALLANVFELSDFGPRLATLIGLGVGIDYALFIVSRFRQGLHAGLEVETAVVVAMDTSGRAVLFAGITVVISLAGMFAMGVPIIQAMATGASLAVLAVLAATLTLVPAALGFAGRAIDRWKVPGIARDETRHRATAWFRWSRLVQRRPWLFAILGTVILLALAIPALSMRLGSADAGSDPTTKTTRRAYDLLAEGFGPGFNGPFLVAVELPAGRPDPLPEITNELSAVPGVRFVAPVQRNRAGDTAIVPVFPESAPQDARTVRLLHHLRTDVTPGIEAATGTRLSIGGITALFDDLGELLAARLPVFIAVVIGLSFVLLMLVFRSIVIPLKAAVMNLLSIGAAYGVIVAVFQWGWASDVVGIDKTGPIQSFIPMLLFAVLFGLSMDYEVFLLSRIREEYLRTGDNALAVADGLATTARVITAAAAIMVAVFGSAVLAEDRTTKLFGLGLATAVFIDATVVRVLLVPATMELLGTANWWLPGWLDRLLPRISVEREGPVGEQVLEDELVERLGVVPRSKVASDPNRSGR
jgi:RND superfamily putative drug exporter